MAEKQGQAAVRKAPAKRKPLVQDKTLWALLWRLRHTLVRLVVALVALLMVWGAARPWAQGLVEEQHSSGAVRQARAVLRGAQAVATSKLIEFTTPDQAEQYLCAAGSLAVVASAAGFGVRPVKITDVTLDENGIIKSFECVLDYAYRRYRVRCNLTDDIAETELLERLVKPKKA